MERKVGRLLELHRDAEGPEGSPDREVGSVKWGPGWGWRNPAPGLALIALLSLGACGPPPIGPGSGVPPAGPERQEVPAPLVAPPPYAERGAPTQSPETALQDLLRLRGRDGFLFLRREGHVQQVRVLEHSEGGLEPGGGYGFQGVIALDGQRRYARFLFGGAGEGDAQVQRILVLTHHTQIPYTWSAEESLWVAGQEEPLPP